MRRPSKIFGCQNVLLFEERRLCFRYFVPSIDVFVTSKHSQPNIIKIPLHLGSTKPRPTTATRQRPASGKAKLSSSYSLPDLKQSSVDNSSSASSSAASPPFRPAGRSRPPGLPPPLPSHRTPLIRRPSAESSLVVSSYVSGIANFWALRNGLLPNLS